MKSVATLTPRERRLALVVGVLIGCWVVISLLIQPLWNRLHDLSLEIETQGERVQALQRLVVERPAIDQQYQALSPYLERGSGAHLPGVFLQELEALSRRANIQLNLKPRPINEEERLSRFEVEMDLEGSQAGLMTFLDSLLGMPRLLLIERLRISSVPSRQSVLRANLVIQRLFLR